MNRRKIKHTRTLEDDIDFIRCYKLLPALWNEKNPHFRDRNMRYKCYLLLLKKLKESKPTATLHDVKAKINAFRSNFRRHIRKVGTIDEEPELSWRREMRFIMGDEKVDGEIDVEASYSLLKDDLSFDEQVELRKDAHIVYLDDLETDANYNDHQLDTTPIQYKIVKKEKPTPKLIYKNESQDVDTSQSNIGDEYYCWGKMMITELKKMSSKQQIFAKKAITDILMEGQLELLNRDSVKINKTSSVPHVVRSKTSSKTSEDLGEERIKIKRDSKVSSDSKAISSVKGKKATTERRSVRLKKKSDESAEHPNIIPEIKASVDGFLPMLTVWPLKTARAKPDDVGDDHSYADNK